MVNETGVNYAAALSFIYVRVDMVGLRKYTDTEHDTQFPLDPLVQLLTSMITGQQTNMLHSM